MTYTDAQRERDALIAEATALNRAGLTYKGTVTEVPLWPDGSLKGHITVLIDGKARTTYLPHTFKNVAVGDMVTVRKGSGWEVVAVLTPKKPPAVSVSMGTKPPAAATVSGTASGSTTPPRTMPGGFPFPPSSGDGWTRTWGNQVTNELNTISARLNSDHRAAIISLSDRLAAVESLLGNVRTTVNTNATRVNQTVDYAAGASDAMGGVVQALKDERIVK